MAGLGLRQVLHQCLVLARLCHCDGKASFYQRGTFQGRCAKSVPLGYDSAILRKAMNIKTWKEMAGIWLQQIA